MARPATVSFGQSPRDDCRAYRTRRGGDYLPGYGVASFPAAVLIDRRGAVRYSSIGVSPSEMSRLGEMVEKLVKEPAQ